MTRITERELQRILDGGNVRIDDETADEIMAEVSRRVARTCPEHGFAVPCPSCEEAAGGRIEAWNAYRREYLTRAGWRRDSPGCYIYIHEDGTEVQFHPFEPRRVGGRLVEQWRLLAADGRGPDPNKTHMERRHDDSN